MLGFVEAATRFKRYTGNTNGQCMVIAALVASFFPTKITILTELIDSIIPSI